MLLLNHRLVSYRHGTTIRRLLGLVVCFIVGLLEVFLQFVKCKFGIDM